MPFITRAANGGRLSIEQGDGNVTEAKNRIESLEAAFANFGLDWSFDISGDQLTVTFGDHSQQTLTFPIARYLPTGDFAGGTNYVVMNTFRANGKLYEVIYPHLSVAPFDAGANDGLGHNYYSLMLESPSNVLPVGGPTGYSIRKRTIADYDYELYAPTLAGLFDVDFDSSLSAGQVPVWSGSAWVNGFITIGPPLSGTLGGVEATGPETNKYLRSINEDGTADLGQPDFSELSGALSTAQFPPDVTTLAANGSVTLDADLGNIFEVTPNNHITLSATNINAGQEITLIVFTSGTSSYNITFNGGSFCAQGVLATGTADGKVFTVKFTAYPGLFIETSRTVAMTP